MARNPLKYRKLLEKLSKRKHDWKNSPTGEFLFNLGYRTNADNYYWRKDNRTFLRLGENEYPILGDNVTEDEKRILSRYTENPLIAWRYLLYSTLIPLIPALYHTYKGYHNSAMVERPQVRDAILNYHLNSVPMYLVIAIGLLAGSYTNKMLNMISLSRKLPIESIQHHYGEEALKELEKERKGLEGKL